MKVRILTSIASATWSYAPGDIVDMPEDQARTWIKSGLAAPLVEHNVETAMLEIPEKRRRVRGDGAKA